LEVLALGGKDRREYGVGEERYERVEGVTVREASLHRQIPDTHDQQAYESTSECCRVLAYVSGSFVANPVDYTAFASSGKRSHLVGEFALGRRNDDREVASLAGPQAGVTR